MDKQKAKKLGLERRKRRVRAKVSGTPERPRLSVHRTNAHIYAQVINDLLCFYLGSRVPCNRQAWFQQRGCRVRR